MPDVFHMNIEDALIARSLEAAGAIIGYVHLADGQSLGAEIGPHVPAILEALLEAGHDDRVCRDPASPKADVAAEQAIRCLRTLVPRVSA